MKLYSNDYAKNKKVLIGNVVGNKLYKAVEKRKHFMRNQNGYGISEDGLLEAKKNGVEIIHIFETDTGTVYEVPFKTWVEHGIHANYGHGAQVFLPVSFYNQPPKDEGYTPEGLTKLHDAMSQVFGKKKGGEQLKI